MENPTNENEQQPQEAQTGLVFEPAPRYIEIEVPNDSSLFFYKAGIKAGLEAMEQNKRFIALAGDEVTATRIGHAIMAMTTLLETVKEVEVDLVQEYQEFQRQHMSPGMTVGFAPRIEVPDADDEDDDEPELGGRGRR